MWRIKTKQEFIQQYGNIHNVPMWNTPDMDYLFGKTITDAEADCIKNGSGRVERWCPENTLTFRWTLFDYFIIEFPKYKVGDIVTSKSRPCGVSKDTLFEIVFLHDYRCTIYNSQIRQGHGGEQQKGAKDIVHGHWYVDLGDLTFVSHSKLQEKKDELSRSNQTGDPSGLEIRVHNRPIQIARSSGFIGSTPTNFKLTDRIKQGTLNYRKV